MTHTSIFFFSDGTASVRQNGQSIEVDSVTISKSDGGYVLKLTEPSGRITEYAKSGVRELSGPVSCESRDEKVAAHINDYFARLDDEG